MPKFLSCFLIFSFVIMLSGCKKDYYNPDNNETSLSASELFDDPTAEISADFDWKTTKNINIEVKVNDQYNGRYYYIVEVFDDNPINNQDAILYSKGVAKLEQDYSATITIHETDTDEESTGSYLFIKQTSPSGHSVIKMAKISGDNLSVDFGKDNSVKSLTKSSSIETKSSEITEIDDSGITKEYPTPNTTLLTNLTNTLGTTLSLLTGTSYIIPAGETFSGNLSFPYTDSYLYIEGTWENTSSNISTNGWKIIVQNGGKITSTKKATLKINSSSILFTADGGNIDGNNISITQNNESESKIVNLGEMEYSDMNDIIGLYNYGTLTISDYIATNSSNAEILNEGKLTINNNTNNKTSMQGTFQNSGVVTITGDLTSNTSTFILINNGSFETYQLDIQGTIENNCHFIVDDTAELNSTSTLNVSSGGIFMAKKMDVAGTTINLESDAILEVDDLDFKNAGASYIYGPSTGNYALARLYDIKITNWSKPTFDGNLEIESSDYPTNKSATFYDVGNNVIFVAEGESDLTIASTDCNIVGNNSTDTEAPTETTFPITQTSETYTYLFEDLWPALGDYDMNDIVMDINPTYYIDEDNMVEKMTVLITLRASGGTYKLGGAIQLDGITQDEISDVTRESEITLTGSTFQTQSNGLESGQKYAVLPLFDESHKALGLSSNTFINTINGGETLTPKTILYTLNFTTPLQYSSLILSKFNVFIINGGYTNSRYEIHLAGYSPTDRANTLKFGTQDDNSNVNLYKSNTHLIWALAVPGPISYPLEYIKITKAYPDFKNWAISGGTTNTDWYNYPKSEFIY